MQFYTIEFHDDNFELSISTRNHEHANHALQLAGFMNLQHLRDEDETNIHLTFSHGSEARIEALEGTLKKLYSSDSSTESILLDQVEEIKKRYQSPIGMQALEMALLDLVGWPGGCLMFHLDHPADGDAGTHGFQLAQTPGFGKEVTAKLTNMKQLLIARKEF